MPEYVDVKTVKHMEIKTIYTDDMFSPELVWAMPYIETTHSIANLLKPHYAGKLEIRREKNPILKQKVGGKFLKFSVKNDRLPHNYINVKTSKKIGGFIPSTEEETIFSLEERVFEDEDKKSGIMVHTNLGDNKEAEKIVTAHLDKLANEQNIYRIYLRKGFA